MSMTGFDARLPAAQSCAAPSPAARHLPVQSPAPESPPASSHVGRQLGDPTPPGLHPPPGQPQGGRPGLPGRRGPLAGQLVRFIAVGVASTIAYVVLYLLLRSWLPAQAANALSLAATAIANTAANRRLTFGIRGRAHAARHQLRGLIAFAVGLAVTSGALAALHAISAQPSRATEVAVLVLANLVATLVRFGLYRSWVFRGRGSRAAPLLADPVLPSPGERPRDYPDPVQHQLLDLSE